MSSAIVWDPEGTREGELPPWEVAKVAALHTVLHDISAHLDTPAAELIGERVDLYVAGQMKFLLAGGQARGVWKHRR